MGRPPKVTDEVLRKLEDAFLKGLSDREACFYADLAESTFYDYCKKHKDFSERKELLKENVKIRAKMNVADRISGGDIDLSKWYIERKCKDEFSLKQEVQHSGTMSVNNPLTGLTTEELRKLIDGG